MQLAAERCLVGRGSVTGRGYTYAMNENEPYSIDLSQIALDDYQQRLATEDLLPSHKPLRDGLVARFAKLRGLGFTTVQDVNQALSTRKRREVLAERTGIPLKYLVLLWRNIKGYIPNPVSLAEIPAVDEAAVAALAEVGIHNTKQLYLQARTAEAQAALGAETGIAPDVLRELVELADVARLPYVGPVYLRLIYASGLHSVAEIAAADADALYRAVVATHRAHEYSRASLGRKDIALTIKLAGMLMAG